MLELALGSLAGAIEIIVRVIHLIAAEDGFQATLVKRLVVGNQRQTLDEWFNLCPHVGEDGCVVGILVTQAVDALAPVVVVVGFGLDERVERVGHPAVTHHDHTHRAHAGALAVGRLKVYCCKISHGLDLQGHMS